VSIPPRPWRSVPHDRDQKSRYFEMADADGNDIFEVYSTSDTAIADREDVELIVRLVNAEPEIVTALEAARDALVGDVDGLHVPAGDALDKIYDVLAKVRP